MQNRLLLYLFDRHAGSRRHAPLSRLRLRPIDPIGRGKGKTSGGLEEVDKIGQNNNNSSGGVNPSCKELAKVQHDLVSYCRAAFPLTWFFAGGAGVIAMTLYFLQHRVYKGRAFATAVTS